MRVARYSKLVFASAMLWKARGMGLGSVMPRLGIVVRGGGGASIQLMRWTSRRPKADTRSCSMICGAGENPIGVSIVDLSASQPCSRSTALRTFVSANLTSPWKFSKQKIRSAAINVVRRESWRERITSWTPWRALPYWISASR